jgi:hypothetical protein
MATTVALDRVTSLAIEPGAQLVVDGLVTTSLDGSVFDAATLFDLDAGGFRIAEQRAGHEYALAATGRPGIACATAAVATPCLVPRIGALAHERLRTQGELAATLHGGVVIEQVVLPPSPASADLTSTLAVTSALLIIGAALGLALTSLRRRARSALGRVRTAARDALRATRGDATLQRVRREIDAMLARARVLEAARRACLGRLSTIDRVTLDRKRDAHARSTSPDAAETLAWLTAEQAEVERLESDLSSSVLGLQRLESALRVVSMRVREHRGTRARIARNDPADVAAAELELRDAARAEAEHAVAR